MDVYMSDEEKVETLKKWVKEYGVPVLLGIAIALGASYGWNYWKKQKTAQRAQSSAVYEQMLGASLQGKMDVSNQFADYLIENYPDTPYATFAAFMQARQAVSEKKLAVAEKKLELAVDRSKQPVFRQIARVRLARVLLTLNKPKEALGVLKIVDDKAYLAMIDEVEGDAYVMLKNKDAARRSYQTALKATSEAGVKYPLLQMKLDQV